MGMDPAVALTLAAITYRGCELNLSDPYSRELTFKEMTRCLRTFNKVRDSWEIVWGPAGFSPGGAGLDTSAMYVARMLHAPRDVVIAIRGTNFYSVTDWLSNLLIDQRPWTYGDPAAVANVTNFGQYGHRSADLAAAPIHASIYRNNHRKLLGRRCLMGGRTGS